MGGPLIRPGAQEGLTLVSVLGVNGLPLLVWGLGGGGGALAESNQDQQEGAWPFTPVYPDTPLA